MLNEPILWGGLIVGLAVVFTGNRIVAHIDAMSVNLGNGSNGMHAMVADKLISIESELQGIHSTVEGLDFRLSEIEEHVRPEPEPNPFDLEVHKSDRR